MARVEIVCLRSVMPDVVAFVQEHGLLHMEHVPLVVSEAPGFLNPVRLTEQQKADLEQIEEMSKTLSKLVLLLGRPSSRDERNSVAAVKEIPRGEWLALVRLWNRDLGALTRRRTNFQDNIAVLRQYNDMLTAVGSEIDAGKVRVGAGTRLVVLKDHARRSLDSMRTRFDELLGHEYQMVQRRIARDKIVCLITYPDTLDKTVDVALREAGIGLVDSPDTRVRGLTLDEASSRIRTVIQDQQKELAATQEQLAQFRAAHGARLYALHAAVADKLARYNVTENLAGSRMIGVLNGWVPKDRAAGFAQALEDRFPGAVRVAELPMDTVEREQIPTLLKNHPWIRPFEMLLELYPPPTYGTIDPSAWVGISFVLFYGFILADVVYGVALILLAWWLGRRWSHIPALRSASLVGYYMGGAAIFFGVLFGEYVGDLGRFLFGLQPLWIARMSGAITVMYVSIGVGFVHVALSLVLGIREAIRRREKKHVLEKTGMLCALFAIGLALLGFVGVWPFSTPACFMLAVALGVACVVLLVLGFGVMAALQMVEIPSLATNVMSYTRLMALGLASTAIADIGNSFAESIPNLVLGVCAGATVQSFNIAIGLFSPTLHSLRLNYVESLPKFYDPKGKRYKPFRKEMLW